MLKEDIATINKLTALAALKNLESANTATVDLSPISSQLTNIENKINQIPATDLSGINAKLSTIENQINQIPRTDLTPVLAKIDQLLLASTSGLQYTELVLNPSHIVGASWQVDPANLSNIYDNNDLTSTNLFRSGANGIGTVNQLIFNPGIVIPQNNRIFMILALRNPYNNRSGFELQAFDTGGGRYETIWAWYEALSSNSDTNFSIDRTLNFSWDKLRLRVWDIGSNPGEAKIFTLKVWGVG